jgi:hypothetical protein
LKQEDKDIWFPAKKYGYGWGLPITWQGWVVSLSYLLLIVGGSFTLTDSPQSTMYFLIFTLILTILFVYICYKKGEKPKWRWGGNNQNNN